MNAKRFKYVSLILLLALVIGVQLPALVAAVAPPPPVPTTMNYEGNLHGPSGNITGTHQVVFAIWDSANGGSVLWQETHASVSINSGNFSVLLGSINPIDFSVLSAGSAFLGITIDADSEMTPRYSLASVPFAVRSEHSNRASVADGVGSKAVDRPGIADKAIGQGQMGDKAIGRGQMGDKAVGQGQMGDKAIGRGQMGDKAIGQGQMDDKAIGRGQMDDRSVGRSQVATEAITAEHLSPDVLHNPLRLGMLRWWEANETQASIQVMNPFGMAFDGANMWISNPDDEVSKFRASDGSLEATYTVSSDNPNNIVADGQYIYVSHYSGGTVTQLNASDGSVKWVDYVGVGVEGMAFDGKNLWVLNSISGYVRPIDVSEDGPGGWGQYPVGAAPQDIIFDGANIWVSNRGDDTVSKLDAANGSLLGTYPVGDSPMGLAFDGAHVWVANADSDSVTKLLASDGSHVADYSAGTMPESLVFDGTDIWVTNWATNPIDDTVTKLRASDGSLVGTYAVGSGLSAIAFDGANVWVGSDHDSTVHKL